eukprot:4724025-Pleurochrysis_carterae.AAC.1
MSNLMLTSGAPVPDHICTTDFFAAVGKELNHVRECEVLAAYILGAQHATHLTCASSKQPAWLSCLRRGWRKPGWRQ